MSQAFEDGVDHKADEADDRGVLGDDSGCERGESHGGGDGIEDSQAAIASLAASDAVGHEVFDTAVSSIHMDGKDYSAADMNDLIKQLQSGRVSKKEQSDIEKLLGQL